MTRDLSDYVFHTTRDKRTFTKILAEHTERIKVYSDEYNAKRRATRAYIKAHPEIVTKLGGAL